MPAVSVIIPFFDGENYIERCAKSLFEQTLEDIEYIFVNDCSKDASMDILTKVAGEYPHRHNQITIITHDTNKGSAQARLTGFGIAKGDYIINSDSDDYLEPEMFESMLSIMQRYGSDAVVCDYFKDNLPIPSHINTPETENCRDLFLSRAIACRGMQSVWRFMVKREIFKDHILWPNISQGEDLTLIIQAAWYCRDIRYLHKPLYHWRTVSSSLTHALSEESVIKRFRESAANSGTVEKFLSEVACIKDKYEGETVS